MTRTEEFLITLSDIELAFLYHYKYLNYLPNSRKLIDQELVKRNLSFLVLENLVNTHKPLIQYPNHQCYRCGSSKLQTTQEDKKFTSRLEGIDAVVSNRNLKVDRIECLVCGNILQDDNHESNWWEWFKELFKKKSV